MTQREVHDDLSPHEGGRTPTWDEEVKVFLPPLRREESRSQIDEEEEFVPSRFERIDNEDVLIPARFQKRSPRASGSSTPRTPRTPRRLSPRSSPRTSPQTSPRTTPRTTPRTSPRPSPRPPKVNESVHERNERIGMWLVTIFLIILAILALFKKFIVDQHSSAPQQKLVPEPPIIPKIFQDDDDDAHLQLATWYAEEGNACVREKLTQRSKFQSCMHFLINGTDALWRGSDIDTMNAFSHLYASDFQSHDTRGVVRDLEQAKNALLSIRSAFSHIEVRVSDAVCDRGATQGEFRTSKSYVFIGTNDGDSVWGKATNKRVAFPCVQTAILQADANGSFKFKSESILRDELSLLEQLGYIQHSGDPILQLVPLPPRCGNAFASSFSGIWYNKSTSDTQSKNQK